MPAPAETSGRHSDRVPWDDRLAVIHRQYPSAAESDWSEALREYELLGRLLGDVMKAATAPKRRGSRSPLELEAGEAQLREIWGDNFTILPFNEAFRQMAGARTLAQLAVKTGIGRATVHRLLTGKLEPTGSEMEAIARAFGLRPIYFREYRAGMVLAVIAQHLTDAPEASVKLVRQLTRES